MLSRRYLLAICMALCLLKSTTTTEIPSSGRIHRRAVKFGKSENVEKRETNIINHHKRHEFLPRSSFRHKRGKDNSQPPANNLANMQEFVTDLMQMNKDWQEQSMEALKEGKTPKEFSWDEFNQKYNHPLDYGNKDDDGSDNSGDDQPKSSAKTSSTTSSESKKPTSKPSESSSSEEDKPKQTQKPPPQPKPEPKPEPKEQPQPKPEPKPQPKPEPKPQPKPEPKPEPKPQPKPKPQQNNDDNSGSGDDNEGNQDSHGKSGIGGVVAQFGFAGKTMKGDMTYFTPDVGACGWSNTESDFIVAVSAELFQIFGNGISNGNPVCGHKIRIFKNGKSAIATISDECPPCTQGSIDMTPALFKYFEDPDVGRTSVTWQFI
ncbi:uncharacterized protein FA14DRAFT_179448 [Meira miltonrushii]|uniref:RlpA-like protein double-psi beta-barrel domain-containing protein n=1 Tax=Meira miltonrushii TaxID=1280837 RepID=A0A316VFJ0_9BASI|nr:uncharacterized protein FA14DRAFT_179448 [Meira miltonrushii]PWN36084.1 hypothetical protein FA14DRAFT_179448 [Meira miltonrushii]